MSFAAMRSSLFSLRTSSLPLRRAFSTSPISPLARLSLIGRLAATPELIHTASGNEVVKYALGVSYGLSSDRKTSWFNVASFQKEGPSRDYLTSLEKGTLVHVDADATMKEYVDREGNQRTGLNVSQRSIEVLKRPNRAEPEQQEPQEGAEQ